MWTQACYSYSTIPIMCGSFHFLHFNCFEWMNEWMNSSSRHWKYVKALSFYNPYFYRSHCVLFVLYANCAIFLLRINKAPVIYPPIKVLIFCCFNHPVFWEVFPSFFLHQDLPPISRRSISEVSPMLHYWGPPALQVHQCRERTWRERDYIKR